MLSKSGECSRYSATSSGMPLGANQISDVTPGVKISGTQVDLFLDLSVGLYQVCYLPKGTTQFLGTGVSFQIQNYTEGLEVNGIRPNRGLRIAIPKRKSARLVFFRRSGEMNIGDKVSLIRLEHTCFNPDQNGQNMPSSVSATLSGHMVVAALPLIGNARYKVLVGSDAVERMEPNVYKVFPPRSHLLYVRLYLIKCQSSGRAAARPRATHGGHAAARVSDVSSQLRHPVKTGHS